MRKGKTPWEQSEAFGRELVVLGLSSWKSKRRVAAEAGISDTYIRHLEKGKGTRPDDRVIAALGEVLEDPCLFGKYGSGKERPIPSKYVETDQIRVELLEAVEDFSDEKLRRVIAFAKGPVEGEGDFAI